MAKSKQKLGRNYAATESTLISNRKTRKDIADLVRRVKALEGTTDKLMEWLLVLGKDA